MNSLACPFCGARDLEEFVFRKTLSRPGTTPYQAVYERIDDLHESREHWQHLHGCRAWLRVRRDPSTHTVLEVRLLDAEKVP